MLKKTAIAVAAAALMLGAASTAQAGKDSSGNSGDYDGGALFGPLPGQVFNYGHAWGGPYAYYRGYGAYGYAGPRVRGAPSLRQEYPTAPWEEYVGN